MRPLILLISFLFATNLWAEEAKLNTEQCYQKFAHYTPQYTLEHARKARDYFLSHGKEAPFAEFNKISPLTFDPFPFSSPITLFRCDEMRAVTFMIDEMRPTLTEPGYLKKFSDVNGQHTFVALCAKIKGGSVEGAWVMQEHFWIGCEGPVKMGMLALKIPGTPYAIQTSLPSDKYTLEDFQKTLK